MAFGGLFGGSSSSSTPVTATAVNTSNDVKEQLKQQIAQELAVANATELVNKMTENCFEQCQKAPFANGEDVCVSRPLGTFRMITNLLYSIVLRNVWRSTWEHGTQYLRHTSLEFNSPITEWRLFEIV